MTEYPQNSKFESGSLAFNLEDILASDSLKTEEEKLALKFLAAFKTPVSIDYWSEVSQVSKDVLTPLVDLYSLPTTMESELLKVIPIENGEVDVSAQHKAIAVRLLGLWKNRKT